MFTAPVHRVTRSDARRILAGKVLELRKARGLTQEQLAELIGWWSRRLQRVEAGESNLDLDALVELANGLDVELYELLVPTRTQHTRRVGRPARKVPR